MKPEVKTKWSNKIFHYLNYVTVEPTFILYMMAFMITNVVEQQFFLYKACMVNHGLNKTICDNLSAAKYKNITQQVQSTTATFHIWNNIAGHVVPVVLALFVGAWSDKRGRKLPLLIGLLGKLIYSLMIVVNTLQPDWPVEYIIFTATLPSALTGADLTIFASAFTYIIDVSSVKWRTMRVTILEVCYLATVPSGVALGSYLFTHVLNKSYTYMFIINSSLLISAVIYSGLRLEWRTNSRQKPFTEATNKLLDFFDYNHYIATVKTITQKRLKNRRTYLWLLILMMACYTFQRDENSVRYMYCQITFRWTLDQYSLFKTVQSGLQDIILLVSIPIMSRLLGWRDTSIIMVGALSHTIARIFYATAGVGYLFYVGGAFAAVGPIVAPVIRSLVSKIVSSSEKGKAFAVLAVADNAIPLVAGTLYSYIYNVTISFNNAAVFYLTMSTQIGVFVLALYIHVKSHKNEFEIEEKPSEASGSGERTHLNKEIYKTQSIEEIDYI